MLAARLWRLALLVLTASACDTAMFVSTTSLDLVTFDHGESFDTFALHGLERRQSPLFARGYVFLPAVDAVERTMVWTAGDLRERNAQKRTSHPGRVRELAEKVLAKYELLGAMIERSGIVQLNQIVQRGSRARPTVGDLRVYVRLPTARPERPDFPDPGHRKHVVAATVVGSDAYEIFAGRRSLTIREDPAIDDFKPRMRDLLARLERAATELQSAQ